MVESNEDNQEGTLQEAVQRFVEGQLRGQQFDIDEYVQQYPGLENQLRQRLQSLQRIGELFTRITRVDEGDFKGTASGKDLAGQKVGSFEIVEMIGRGGMGEVYLARDTKLQRSVAVKSLPAGLQANSTSQRRFRREAKLLASLNHANIAVIHDIVEQDDGACYLILEYVPGQTLAERIADSSLSCKEMLAIALQIAEALAAAYEQGIIHRDLKPGNIKITPTGEVKVLDFGIAKALGPHHQVQETAVTQAGHLVGTPAYMSPEQMRGKPVDHRTDNWAFGCVLYEMLTGHLAFEGETISDTIAFVLQREPNWSELPGDLPVNIQVLLRRCLEKNAKDRLQHIGDGAVEIRETLNPPVFAPPPSSTKKALTPSMDWRRIVASCSLSFILGAFAVAFIFYMFLNRSEPQEQIQPVQRMVISLPEGQAIAPARMMPLGYLLPNLAISANGSYLVYTAAQGEKLQLYLRSFEEFEPRPIAGTEGGCSPFFSPDGQSIGFFAEGKLRTISLRGGQALTLCDAGQPKGACWGPDGMIYFSHTEGQFLSRIPQSGGDAERLVAKEEPEALDRFAYGHPQLLPDGKHLLLSSMTSIFLFSLTDGERQLLIERGQHARYLPTGHILYAWAGALQTVAFDPTTCRKTGSPVTVLDGILLDSLIGTAQLSVSNNGTLVYIPGGDDTVRSIPVWIDRTGKTEPLGLPAAVYGTFQFSPDGQRLCIERKEGTQIDIYIWAFAETRLTRLTREGYCRSPLWTPDGGRVVFGHRRKPLNLAWQSVDGAGDIQQLYMSPHYATAYCWLPDGRQLAFTDFDPDEGQDIWILPVEEGCPPQPLIKTPATEWGPAFSPNGRWIAYVSDRDGQYQVYVKPYPAMDDQWPVSDGFGEEPIWSPTGDELYYRDGDKWMAVSISTEPEFATGVPRLLFEGPYLNVPGRSYDISPDGQRFVVLEPEHDDSAVQQIHVVLNWFEELKRLVPAE